MKPVQLKLAFTLLFVFVCSIAFGQKLLIEKPKDKTQKQAYLKPINSKYSASTALFLNGNNASSKTNSITKKGIDYVNTAILLNESCSIDNIRDLPILLNTGSKHTITALVPIDSFELVSNNDCVKYLDIGVPSRPLLDEARFFTNTDEVHEGLGLNSSYDGTGVVVGIIDTGFDFTHPTFKDANGDLRISKVWIQNDISGLSPAGYNYGTEYVGETQILTKQIDTNTESHGTHVTGIATGIGTNNSSNDYRGIAYNSEIVLVSYQPTINQQISNNSTNIIDALNYLVNYAKSINKPIVINMSLGSHFGAHDGSSILDQEIDDLSGDGIIIVGSAGNEGNKKIHASSTFNTKETKYYFVENNQKPSVAIDIWGNVNTNFDISFSIYKTITDNWIAVNPEYYNTNNSSNNQIELNDSSDSDKWIINYAIPNPEPNLKPRALVTVNYSNDLSLNDGDIFVLEIKAENTTIHAWCNSEKETAVFENYAYANVEDGDTNFTVAEIGGTANDIITVGAYTSKSSYVDFSGNSHNIPNTLGDIAPFSSIGPTVDGRIKPDITAPGNVVVSSVNSFDNNFTSTSPKVVSGVTDGFKNWWFGRLQGTSMSAPVVTGIIALWLQARPNLNVNDIKAILDNTAIQDSFTGNTNNNTWGRGKIDAWLAMFLVEQSLGTNEKKAIQAVKIYPNPTSNFIILKTNLEYSNIELFNTLGKKVKDFTVVQKDIGYSINLENLQSGVYFLSLTNSNKHENIRVVKN